MSWFSNPTLWEEDPANLSAYPVWAFWNDKKAKPRFDLYIYEGYSSNMYWFKLRSHRLGKIGLRSEQLQQRIIAGIFKPFMINCERIFGKLPPKGPTPPPYTPPKRGA